jgi:hypothetical protein
MGFVGHHGSLVALVAFAGPVFGGGAGGAGSWLTMKCGEKCGFACDLTLDPTGHFHEPFGTSELPHSGRPLHYSPRNWADTPN